MIKIDQLAKQGTQNTKKGAALNSPVKQENNMLNPGTVRS